MSHTTAQNVVTFLSGGTLLTAFGFVLRFIYERRQLGVEAQRVGISATQAITEATLQLINPLREELANERASNAQEIELEREKVAQVRFELAAMMDETKALRAELRLARQEADKLRQENAAYKARVQQLEDELSLHRRKS